MRMRHIGSGAVIGIGSGAALGSFALGIALAAVFATAMSVADRKC